jgi:hypothetical protein
MQSMAFIEWWIVRHVAFGLAMIALGAFAFWIVRRKGRWPRLLMRPLSLGIALVGAFIVVYWLGSIGYRTYSAPIYSPDGKTAARIRTGGTGGIGSANIVELWSRHGFEEDDVFDVGWGGIEPQDVRWNNDSELTITYHGYPNGPDWCFSTPAVKVHCMDADKSVH